jgi:putative hydrolase of the HAD superfamily
MEPVEHYAGIIFDYGGVLVSHQTEEDARHLSQIAGLAPDLFFRLYWSDRGDYDKGLMTGDDYWNRIAERAGTSFSPDQILQLIDTDNQSWTHFDTQMYKFVENLRASGKRLAVLSNMPRDLGESLKAKATTQGFAPFHHITLSYEVRSIKPEPEIYEHCLAGLGLRAEQTLFLDDRAENVEGAKRLGIQAIQFTSRDEVLPRLQMNGRHG